MPSDKVKVAVRLAIQDVSPMSLTVFFVDLECPLGIASDVMCRLGHDSHTLAMHLM